MTPNLDMTSSGSIIIYKYNPEVIMRRYLIPRICRVTVLWATISLIPSLSLATLLPETGIVSQKYIIQVNDRNQVQSFAEKNNIEISPLISYPDPSEEVTEIFADYYLISVSAETQENEDNIVNLLLCKSWIKSVQRNETVSLPEDPYNSQTIRNFDGQNPLSDSPDDPLFPYQWDKMITKTSLAWSKTTGSSEVTIAILDSGVDTDHEDLAPNVVSGYDFLDRDTIIEDDNGHGTKIAGVIAGKINNALGIAGIAGNSKIMALKVVNSFGNVKRSDAINAILYAVDNGADVITMSFGFNGPIEAEEEAIEYAWRKGVFITASAGNKAEIAPAHYPSSYEHVMAVGASDSVDARVDFSNYGDNVDIYAPGKSVWMTLMDGGYGTGSGTSYAAPQIAGLAALIQSTYTDYSAQEVWDAIVYGADTIITDVGLVIRMNAKKSLDNELNTSAVVSEFYKDSEEIDEMVCISQIHGKTVKFSVSNTQSGNYYIYVYDLSGKVVYRNYGSISPNADVILDLNLVSGVYFWQYRTDSSIYSGKLVAIR
ncbi:S8 family serine peptidase [candidate division WOR-3 bacterium]|uniref:S8 family serine peptidase n=1 Tax=candidate division WOR-3 bacterium TaxID=2052148 RepID=A0A9D5KC99_UNCW3|nr:S8 family serine peptidase [candidate division WOR-3 bacterium]MBD3365076.1 S8 family serine peptidase [candidate division WOR-3 bacterium]